MFSTAWKRISAVPLQTSSYPRHSSTRPWYKDWYRNLDDETRAIYADDHARTFQARYADSIFRETYLRNQRIAYKESERARRSNQLKTWCNSHPWVREQMPWKSHRPIRYEQRVKHYCNGCEWTPPSGRKLWWASLADNTVDSGSREYLCHNCYTKQDWDQVMPAGYEDLRTYKDVAARSKHLGHAEPASSKT